MNLRYDLSPKNVHLQPHPFFSLSIYFARLKVGCSAAIKQTTNYSCPETLKKIANSPVHNPFGANVPDYSAYTSVSDWLASIKMSRYVDNFSHHNVTTIDAVAKLSLQQLVDMGITLVGHQKKIMGSIHAMRAQLSVNVSEGFLV